ncbi:hypothetical protein AMK25_06555 [Micromonospora sp. TSRI0369]|nr:hypothetical protein AMK25_06555 [Micromonospora sp. TSRI0369]
MRRNADKEAQSFGPALRERRNAAGLSLTELSQLVHYSKSYLSKIETGLKVPSLDLARRCDAQLGASGALAALAPHTQPNPSPPPAGTADVWAIGLNPDGHSEFSGRHRQGPHTTGVATVYTWRLRPTSGPRHTEGETLPAFLTIFQESRRLGQTIAPAALIPMLIAQTNALRIMAPQAKSDDRARILTLAARFAEYTGWMAQEAGDDGAAMWWTDHACDLAEAAGYHDLAAYALVRQALITMYRHNAPDTVELSKLAQEQTQNPRICGLAAQREAQGHAIAGDYDACLRALDRARNLLNVPGEDDEPIIGTSTIEDPVTLATAWCLHDLGRPEAAVEIFDAAIRRIPAHAHRAKARYTARWALALAATGEAERACLEVEPVLEALARADSATIRVDLRRLAQELARAHHKAAVRELAPRLASALHTGILHA